jgi:predicted phosphodiesterase
MDNIPLKFLALICFFGLLSCEKGDLRGIFVSYESVNDRFEQSMTWNRLHSYKKITLSTNDYEIFSMGDCQIGGVENLNLFFKEAVKSNATAIVMDGDLTSGRENDYIAFQDNLINAGSVDVFPIAGNHDLYFNGWKEYYSRFGSSTYYFTVKTPNAEDLFICLDSASGTLGSEQIDWLKKLLENERPDYRHCVVFTHNNFFRSWHKPSTNPLVEELYILMELFLIHKVDMIITGHDHSKSVERLGNTLYIVMDALLDGFKDAGYLKIIIKGNNEISYEFVNL